MRAFVSPKEMSWLDAETMRRRKIGPWDLMKEVAEEMAEHLLALTQAADKVVFLLGAGNNAGDGYVAAEILRRAQRQVFLLALEEPKSKEAKRAARACEAPRVTTWPTQKPKLIVDALAGNQSRAQIPKHWHKFLRQANRFTSRRVALDIPTGVDTQSGEVHELAFEAERTLCVAYPREVMAQERVARHTGRVIFVGKGFASPRFFEMATIELSPSIYDRPATDFKRGRCAVVAGSSQSPGAAFLCAEAAQRVGAGYAELFFEKRKSLQISFSNASFQYADRWSDILKKPVEALVIGCGGLPRQWKKVAALDCAQVFDAEALRKFEPKDFRPHPRRLLTPHPGEAKALLGRKTLDFSKDRREILEALVKKTGQSVYLKGAPGLLSFAKVVEDDFFSDGLLSSQPIKYYVNLSIQKAFATAGSGDVLSGILGGFLAQKPQSFREGVFAGLAFQKALGDLPQVKRGWLASDQLKCFSEVFERIERG